MGIAFQAMTRPLCIRTRNLKLDTEQLLSYCAETKDRFMSPRLIKLGLFEGKATPNPKITDSRILDRQHGHPLVAPLVRGINESIASFTNELGMKTFQPIGQNARILHYGDGVFFKPHSDNYAKSTMHRVLTCLYYFHREPKRFTGGELVLYGGSGRVETIEPENGLLVVFDSSMAHEVKPVVCSSNEFLDGRFCITVWIHRYQSKLSRIRRDARMISRKFGFDLSKLGVKVRPYIPFLFK